MVASGGRSCVQTRISRVFIRGVPCSPVSMASATRIEGDVNGVSRNPAGDGQRLPSTTSSVGSASVDSSQRTSSGSRWAAAGEKVALKLATASHFVTLRDRTDVNEIEPSQLKTLRRLGEGAFAVVDLCDLSSPLLATPRQVAVKRLKPEIRESPDDLDLFMTETSLMRKLKHKYVVEYVGMGCEDATSDDNAKYTLFLVQEFLGGGCLKTLVMSQMDSPQNLYTNAQALQWLTHVASALAYLHTSNPVVTHRDLKLDNILLSKDTKVAKLADFGLVGFARNQVARKNASPSMKAAANNTQTVVEQEAGYSKAMSMRVQSMKPQTSSKRFMKWRKSELQTFQPRELEDAGLVGKTGTLMYMAPEMYKSEPTNEKVDVFSFGIIMYELLNRYLTLCAISRSGSEQDMEDYAKRVSMGYRPPLPINWPMDLKALIKACWDQDPSARPTMDQVVQRLQHIISQGLMPEEEEYNTCVSCFG